MSSFTLPEAPVSQRGNLSFNPMNDPMDPILELARSARNIEALLQEILERMGQSTTAISYPIEVTYDQPTGEMATVAKRAYKKSSD